LTSSHLLYSRHSFNIYIFIHHNNDVTQKKFRLRVLVMCYLRMAVMHLPTKFCTHSSIQFGVIDIFRNPRWRPPPSWIFKSCKFGTFRHVNSVVLELYIKFGSNICYSHRDQHTYAPDVYLMTSPELTSAFDFWSGGHLRMAVVHLPIKFGVDICIQFRVIDISLKFKMAAAAILDFQFVNLAIPAC